MLGQSASRRSEAKAPRRFPTVTSGRSPSDDPAATRAILTAMTRGLNMTIGEALEVESEQFARLVLTEELRQGVDHWIRARKRI